MSQSPFTLCAQLSVSQKYQFNAAGSKEGINARIFNFREDMKSNINLHKCHSRFCTALIQHLNLKNNKKYPRVSETQSNYVPQRNQVGKVSFKADSTTVRLPELCFLSTTLSLYIPKEAEYMNRVSQRISTASLVVWQQLCIGGLKKIYHFTLPNSFVQPGILSGRRASMYPKTRGDLKYLQAG